MQNEVLRYMNIFSALTQWCMIKGISFIACYIIHSKRKLYFNQLIGCTIFVNCKETVIESNMCQCAICFFFGTFNLWLNGTLQINEKFLCLTKLKDTKREVLASICNCMLTSRICCRARAVRSIQTRNTIYL